tara:strand:- start:314 stop:1096 length:783 start_codon:yes stop_codon:yes gene_type:complete
MKLPKKSLGQNFLIDKNIIKKIIKLTNLQGKHILEIGPGRGALTEEILKKNPSSLIVVEKDRELADLLKKKYKNNKILKIYNNDILKFNIEKIIKKGTKIFGNLPYNVSSQILVKIIKFKKWPPKFSDLILMFQKEMGEKIVASYPSSNYGRLSILTYLRLINVNKFMVSPNCFRPRPKINSLVLHFKPKKMLFNINDISILEKITNIFFSKKRKMINKTIKNVLSNKQIDKIPQINLSSRPSEIEPEIYYKITELIENR